MVRPTDLHDAIHAPDSPSGPLSWTRPSYPFADPRGSQRAGLPCSEGHFAVCHEVPPTNHGLLDLSPHKGPRSPDQDDHDDPRNRLILGAIPTPATSFVVFERHNLGNCLG